jgi:hypothetical protein
MASNPRCSSAFVKTDQTWHLLGQLRKWKTNPMNLWYSAHLTRGFWLISFWHGRAILILMSLFFPSMALELRLTQEALRSTEHLWKDCVSLWPLISGSTHCLSRVSPTQPGQGTCDREGKRSCRLLFGRFRIRRWHKELLSYKVPEVPFKKPLGQEIIK